MENQVFFGAPDLFRGGREIFPVEKKKFLNLYEMNLAGIRQKKTAAR